MRILLKIVFFVAITIFFICIFFYSKNILLAPGRSESLQSEVCFRQNCFLVELAKTSAQREKGLMFREKLDKNAGMLFIFDKEDVYPFWMKNTLIPLDIIWINKDKKIVFIEKFAQPCEGINCALINPGVDAKYVLEINAGISDEFDIKVGDAVGFDT